MPLPLAAGETPGVIGLNKFSHCTLTKFIYYSMSIPYPVPDGSEIHSPQQPSGGLWALLGERSATATSRPMRLSASVGAT